MREKDRQSGRGSKRTDSRIEKGPTIATLKGPTNYRPVRLSGVMDDRALKALLHRRKQAEWTTPKRIAGLLLLIDFMLRKSTRTFQISSELAREYVGRLKGKQGVQNQPLALLVKIGILEMVRPAKVGPHLKIAAEYRIASGHLVHSGMEIFVTPQQLAKLENAESRNELRKNRKHPFRARLIEDLKRVTLSTNGKAEAFDMKRAGRKQDALERSLEYLEGKRIRLLSVDATGTAHCFINGMPKELKRHLEIDGKPVVKCDIEGAHICMLQRIISDRASHLRRKYPASTKPEQLAKERDELATMIEAGDLYSLGQHDIRPDDRKASKRSMLSALNMKTPIARHIPEYLWLCKIFPLTMSIVEDLKEKDHRTLSLQLRNYTSRVINGALLELQSIGIPALPDTDALIVPAESGTLARETIERFLRNVAGAGKVSIS